MATAESHDVVIRWQQQGQAAVAADAKKIQTSFSGIGASLTKSLAGAEASIKKSLASVQAAAKQTGAIMTAGITVPLLAMGKGAIGAASDLNESMSAVNAVFGDAADTVIAFSKTTATAFGITQTETLTAATSLSGFTRQMGLSKQESADFSTKMVEAAGHLASFANQDPSDMLAAMRSGLSGEAEPLKRFGFDLSDVAVKAKGLALGLTDANGVMSEGAKIQARQALILEQMGPAWGDATRTIGEFAGSQKVLDAQMQELSASVGEILLPVAADLVSHLKDLVAWVKGLSPSAQELAVKIGLVAAAAGPVLLVLSQVGPVLAGLASGPFLLAAGAAVALYKAWESNFLGIRDIVMSVVDRIGTFIGRAVEFFQHAKERGLDPFRLAFRTMIQGIKAALGDDNPVLDFFRGILRNGEKLAEWWKTDGSTTLTTISNLFSEGNFGDAAIYFGHLAEDIKGGWDKTVGPWIDEQVGKASAFAATLLSSIVEGFKGVNWDLLWNEITTGLGAFKDETLGPAFETLKTLGATVVSWAVASFKGVNWDLVVNEITTGLGNLKTQGLDPALGELKTAGALFLQAVFDSFKGVNWDLVFSDVQTKAKESSDRYGLFDEVDIQTPVDNIIKNTRIALAWFGTIPEYINGESKKGDWELTGDGFADFGRQLGESLWTNTADELGQIKNAGAWVLEQLGLVDWQPSWDKMKADGSALMGQVLGGFGEAMGEISAWFNGTAKTGTTEAFGDRIHSLITGALAQAKDKITGAGKLILQWVIDGLELKWTELETWFTTHNPGDLIPSGWFNVDAGTTPETNPDLSRGARAFGGPGRGWAMVGEAGPELVKLPLGAMVIPHTASMSRLRGMLNGGVVDWRDPESGLRALRALRNDPNWTGDQGALGVRIRFLKNLRDRDRSGLVDTLAHGQLQSELGGLFGGGRPATGGGNVTVDRTGSRRGQNRGFTTTEDGSLVPDSYFGLQGAHAMAQGGASDWQTWLQSLTASSRRHIRDLRASGDLTAANRRAFMAGEIDDFDVRQIGSDQPLNRRATSSRGVGGATDWKTWVGALTAGQRRDLRSWRAEGGLTADVRRNIMGWPDVDEAFRAQRRAERRALAAGGGGRGLHDPFHDQRRAERRDLRDAGTSLDNFNATDRYGRTRGDGIHIYGNVTINPPDADVAGEFSRQFSNRNRV